jgi:hypothetical protein
MFLRNSIAVAAAIVPLALPSASAAAVLPVPPGESIQAAIDQSRPGDVILLEAGLYTENIDFSGKAVTVEGLGVSTVLHGTGAGSVVTFSSGEGPDSVLDSVVVTGGSAELGGGIYIADASPTVIRTVIFNNAALSRGSGVYLTRSSAELRNNAVLYNHTGGGDPHAVEVVNASPTIVNNTILRNDSNGIILRGDSPALTLNNLIGLNGSRGRGRGICDFSGGVARIHYNLFWRNRIAALLTDGRDFRSIVRAERVIGLPRLTGNVKGYPEFTWRRRLPRLGSRRFQDLTLQELLPGLQPRLDGRRQKAIDAGQPDPVHDDLDGSRNDIGMTGGPEAPLW